MDGEGKKRNRWLSAFFVLLSLLLSGCGSVTLFNNLEESEVNEMIAILKQYGISSSKIIRKESCALSLSLENFSTAIDLLGAHGYPLPRYQTLGDVFKKSGLVSSPLEERIRFMNALGESIALTLSKIPGVLKARVHVVIPDNDPYAEKTVPASASVFIAFRQDSTVEDSVREIKNLVSNSVEGLEFEKVTVSLFPVVLPQLPKALGKSDTIFSIAGIDMMEGSKMQFFILVGILIAIIVILVISMIWIIISANRKKKEKEIQVENLAEAADNPPPAKETAEKEEEKEESLD
jgi:type III secretion protein J